MKAKQTSESIELGVILAMSGGMMDAYSYIARGEVFANAQTGNMLLFGVRLSEGNFHMALQYLCPILAFTLGIMVSDIVRSTVAKKLHWRQVAVLIEAVMLLCVAVIPGTMNLLANSLTSFACGIQVEAFRKIHGRGIATTMCIGNLRSATQNICNYFIEGNKENLLNGILYLGIITSFILGAVIGNFCIKILELHAIIISAILLIISFFVMFTDREKEIH